MKHYPITPEERSAFKMLSWPERVKAYIRRHRGITDVYTSDVPYIPYRLKGGWSQSGLEQLDSIIADGTQISNTTTETIICPDFSIPGFFESPYKTIQFWAFGVCSNVVTTPGTLTFRVRWGGVSGTVLLASAAYTLDTTARTNALWAMWGNIVCRTAGPTGTLMSGGLSSIVQQRGMVALANNGEFTSSVGLLGSAGAPIASGNAAVTVDTTTQKALSLTAAFSVATSPTNLTCQQRIIICNN